MRSIKIVIVTPVHNRSELTLRCLKSLKRSRLGQIEAHIIVVDDGSTDGTAEAISMYHPDVEVLRGSGDLWYTGGTNRGLEAGLKYDPDYILAINNDSIFDDACIRLLVDCAERYPGSVVGPLLLDWEIPHRIFQVAPLWDLWSGGFRHWRHQTVWTVPDKPWEVEIIVGNCVLYPSRAVRENGFMDEKRLVHYGDAEYTPRMRRKGWKLLIEPRARVFCQPNTAASGFRKMPFAKKFEEAVLRPAGPYSLKRRIHMTLAGAPNRLQGIIAIYVYFFRALLGRNVEGQWGFQQPEKPLAEIFSKNVVRDGGPET